jgi:hypothetical protein
MPLVCGMVDQREVKGTCLFGMVQVWVEEGDKLLPEAQPLMVDDPWKAEVDDVS